MNFYFSRFLFFSSSELFKISMFCIIIKSLIFVYCTTLCSLEVFVRIHFKLVIIFNVGRMGDNEF